MKMPNLESVYQAWTGALVDGFPGGLITVLAEAWRPGGKRPVERPRRCGEGHDVAWF